ncbi:3-oxoacyl-ACP synthase III family protein [Sediminicola luteus]|uniref:3-oxoacyl-ACP synthase n=1 Tax=Sediminicola luteus TaxID=319238 RepID=A0A2A4G9B8_9FLAO|nr:ketoacyl-ACP synthase III [Sediminicola luteus]PCE64570.1 3-oxoacyl-ACP synthase [Sediminicola luteus]
MARIGITGTGCYIPKVTVGNDHFLEHTFLNPDGSGFKQSNPVIIKKFKAITGIDQRRYATEEQNSSDLGYYASLKALEDADLDKEKLDYIIYAHNFGDVPTQNGQSDMLPSLASRVKQKLGIKNPGCIAYDLIYGCPGWVQAMIHAESFIKSGLAKRCLIIGGETLSRVVDPYDRDSMIFSDGAGATILEATEQSGEILGRASATYANEEADFLFFGKSNHSEPAATKYIKMHGRKIYEFALTYVPQAMKQCLDESGIPISEVKKIFIHQANEKMDQAIIDRFYELYDAEPKADVMPMNIQFLGNSSVATVPTLFDQVRKGKVDGHQVQKGDVVIFASVGAGMNINALVYRY